MTEENDRKDELTNDYIHELEADLEALKQRHEKLVAACIKFKKAYEDESAGSDFFEAGAIFHLLEEEPCQVSNQ